MSRLDANPTPVDSPGRETEAPSTPRLDPGTARAGLGSLLDRARQARESLFFARPIPGNDVRVLEDGEQAFPVMLAAIRAARDHVHLEVYWLASDSIGWRFAEALAERARAGVAVRVIVDAVGSLGTRSSLFEEIEGAGGQVHVFRPLRPWQSPRLLHRRNHRKILVVDGRVGFAGGMNLCDAHLPRSEDGQGWRDTHLRIEGPAVRELAKLFRRTWETGTGEPLPPARYLPVPDSTGSSPVLVVANRDFRRRHTIRQAYLQAFHHARDTILLSQAYFLPDRGIQRALADAVRRGVEVRVLLGGRSDVRAVQYATRHLYGRLLAGGMRIHEWPERVLHAKTACVDGAWSAVGSYNLDHRSLRHNLEVVLFVAGEEVGARMQATLRAGMATSPEIDLETWRRRPLLERAAGALWHALRYWM